MYRLLSIFQRFYELIFWGSIVGFFFLIFFASFHNVFAKEKDKNKMSKIEVKKHPDQWYQNQVEYQKIRHCLDTFSPHKDLKEECLYLEYVGNKIQFAFKF